MTKIGNTNILSNEALATLWGGINIQQIIDNMGPGIALPPKDLTNGASVLGGDPYHGLDLGPGPAIVPQDGGSGFGA